MVVEAMTLFIIVLEDDCNSAQDGEKHLVVVMMYCYYHLFL